eukprot:jgi/Mesvir1/20638/Mv14860-RA.1
MRPLVTEPSSCLALPQKDRECDQCSNGHRSSSGLAHLTAKPATRTDYSSRRGAKGSAFCAKQHSVQFPSQCVARECSSGSTSSGASPPSGQPHQANSRFGSAGAVSESPSKTKARPHWKAEANGDDILQTRPAGDGVNKARAAAHTPKGIQLPLEASGQGGEGECVPTFKEIAQAIVKSRNRQAVDALLSSWPPSSRVGELNGLMKHMGLRKKWQRALDVFQWMERRAGGQLDTSSYTTIISVLGRNQQGTRATAILDRFLSQGGPASLQLVNTLVAAYAQSGMPDDAARLVGAMRSKYNLQPDVYSYASLMTALARAGRVDEAFAALADMRAGGCAPNAFVASALMSACINAGQYTRAVAVHEALCRGSPPVAPNVIVYSTLITAYTGMGAWEAAAEVFEEMSSLGLRPDVYAYSALISAYDKAGQSRRARAVFDAMVAAGIKPNVVAYSAMISAHGQAGEWEAALDLLRAMEAARCRPNLIVFNALISACANGRRLDRAMDVLTMLRARGLRPNVITFTSLIAAAEKVGDVAAVQRLHSQMLTEGLVPDEYTVASLISSYGNAGQWEDALAQFRSAQAQRLALDTVVYNALISACAKCDQMYWAEKVFADMKRDGLVACDVVTYNSLMSGYEKAGRWREALALLREMTSPPPPSSSSSTPSGDSPPSPSSSEKSPVAHPPPRPHTITYNIAISACAKAGELDMALRLLRELERGGRSGRTTPSEATEEREGKGESTGSPAGSLALTGKAERADPSPQARGRRVPLSSTVPTAPRDPPPQPDYISYNSVLTGCVLLGRWDTAVELLEEMKAAASERVAPDATSYNRVVAACCAGGRWHEAFAVAHEAASLGHPLEADTANALLRLCTRSARSADDALAMWAALERLGCLRVDGETCRLLRGMTGGERGALWELALRRAEMGAAANANTGGGSGVNGAGLGENNNNNKAGGRPAAREGGL